MNEGFIENYINRLPANSARVAIDIGANHGNYTRALIGKFQKVIAFEPHPNNLRELHQRVKEHDKDHRVVIEDAAVGVVDGEVELYENDNPGGHSINRHLAEIETWGHKVDKFIRVRCVRLDTYCRDMDVGFIKCDVEAGESFIFEGGEQMLRRCCPPIMLEVHNAVEYERLHKFFTDIGYRWTSDAGIVGVPKLQPDTHYFIEVPDLP